MSPLGARVERARHAEFIAFVVQQRRRWPPGRTFRAIGLAAQANAEQGVFAQVGFDDAVHRLLLLGQVVHERLAIFIGRDEAPTHIAFGGQRATDVELTAVGVPAAGTQRHMTRQLAGRPLAHQVDGRRGAAEAAEQARGATQHLHPVVDGHVGLVDAVAEAECRRDAINLEVVDVKARALKLARLLSSLLTVTPGVLPSTSLMLVRFWSSICWRVITLTDCGVSRGDSAMRVAVRVAPVV
jgi:hypothetical protein